MSLSDSF